MLEYLESGFASALWQMVSGVLSFVFVAYILHAVGTKLKANMAAFLGKVYRIVVIPGEFVRNVGISLACMITRVKVRRHIITTDAPGSYVSITHSRIEAGTPAGFIRNLVILTAPIWFGCVVIGVIALIAGGDWIDSGCKRRYAVRGYWCRFIRDGSVFCGCDDAAVICLCVALDFSVLLVLPDVFCLYCHRDHNRYPGYLGDQGRIVWDLCRINISECDTWY